MAREHGESGVPEVDSGTADPEFTQLLPAFFGVLRNLVQKGIPIDVGDGLDHIHDFYLDAWPGVRARFDASKGSFRSYAIAAFYRFARRRAIQELVRSKPIEPDDLPTRTDVEESAVDRDRVAAALRSMDAASAAILRATFNDASLSERALAHRMGLSRYAFRVRQARALAELAARLGERGVLSEQELRIAEQLFVENRRIPEAAIKLGLTEAQVRKARSAIVGRFQLVFRSGT